jgi:cyanoexosortase A
MASPSLLRRWLALDARAAWLLLAGLVAAYLLVLSLLTQPADEAVNLLLLIGGAVLLFPGLPEGWQPRPGRMGRWLGVALLLAVFWRGQRMVAFDFTSSLLLPLAGIALALLAAPPRQWRPFAWPLAVLAVLPLWRAVGWLTPLGPLSELSAWLSYQWLALCGFSAQQQGIFVTLPGGGVKVSAACAGLNILLQLVVVAALFAKAFPMRRRWQNGLMIVVAPLIAVLINAMRIALLAWINASGGPYSEWWFDFLHDSWGSLLFAGIAMQLFVWLYVYWLARQVAALGSR